MESAKENFEKLFTSVKNYTQTSIQLAKYKAIDSAINVTTSLVAKLGVILVISIFFLIFNIGVAIYLGELLGKLYYGFFIVAGFYLFAGIVLHYSLSKWLKKPVGDTIIKQIFQN